MRAILKNIAAVLILLGSVHLCSGQETFAASGGDIEAVTGSVCYSVGQTFCSRISNSEGLIQEGVQQHVVVCTGDYNGDLEVNTSDLLLFLVHLPCYSDCDADLTGDGVVDTNDLLEFLSAFGGSCAS